MLSLPIHCLALGCTTIGQLEDDVRIAQQFKPMTPEQMAALRTRADKFKGPRWKTGSGTSQQASAPVYRDGVIA